MRKDVAFFKRLLLWVFDQHIVGYQSPTRALQRIIDKTFLVYRPFFDSSVLEKHLPSDDRLATDFADAGMFLYLRPTEKGAFTVPALSLKADFRLSLPEVRIRLVLFLLDDQGDLRSLGYRFETPEGPGDGRHDYYHVQPIRSVFKDRPGFQLSCPLWFPDTHPTWPIDANDPITLCLSSLFSLYGLSFRDDLSTSPIHGILKKYLDRTHCLTLPPPTFWQVGSKRSTLHFKTWFDDGQFGDYCAVKMRDKHTKKRILPNEYYALPLGKQLRC
jgi:hypothetical protein